MSTIEIVQAAWEGDTAAVRKLLDEGAKVDAHDVDETSKEQVESVLAGLSPEDRAKINIVMENMFYGSTALHKAADGVDDLPTVKLLLASGANINAHDENFDTPLLLALQPGGSVEIAMHLIDAGADVNTINGTFSSLPLKNPLTVAVGRNPEEERNQLVSALLGKGANPNYKNPSTETPLFLAVELGRVSTAKLLMEGGATLESNNEYLFAAVDSGSSDMVKLLLEKGCDTSETRFDVEENEKIGSAYTALDFSRRRNFYDPLIEALLCGDAIQTDTPSVWSDIFASHKSDCADVLAKLSRSIERGADVDALNPRGDTALTVLTNSVYSATKSDVTHAVCAFLLDAGADPNVIPSSLHLLPPLLAASYAGDARTVSALLSAGAQSDLVDAETGNTALHWAAKNHHTDNAETVAQLLMAGTNPAALNHHGNTAQALNTSLAIDDIAIALNPLLAGDVNGHNANGDTALTMAIENKWHTSATVIIEQFKADVNAPGSRNTTPLQIAAERYQIREMVFLIEKGAEINVKDGNGNTPLHHAVAFGAGGLGALLNENEQQRRVIYELMLGGLDAECPNHNGETPRYLAGKCDPISGIVDGIGAAEFQECFEKAQASILKAEMEAEFPAATATASRKRLGPERDDFPQLSEQPSNLKPAPPIAPASRPGNPWAYPGADLD